MEVRHLFIITCYQYEITAALINLLGRDRCRLVVDLNSNDIDKFHSNLNDLIISEGNFGYYTIDEALGRIHMIRAMKYNYDLRGKFDMYHIISQNDLPTAHFYRSLDNYRDNYVHVSNHSWVSNYMTLNNEGLDILYKNLGKAKKVLINMINGINPYVGAPSESIFLDIVSQIPDRVNSDLRLYCYLCKHEYFKNTRLVGKFTKELSPLTYINSPELISAMEDEDSGYLFARKFDYSSDIYKIIYDKALNKYG